MSEFLQMMGAYISSTPLWVWGILAYILFVGVKSMRTHRIFLPLLFIIPVIFLGLRYELFLNALYLNEGWFAPLIYISAVMGEFPLGWFVAHKTPIKIIKESYMIEVPGSYQMLVLLLVFFGIKFIFGHLKAVGSEIAIHYAWVELVATGLLTGYFLGRACGLAYRFYKNDE